MNLRAYIIQYDHWWGLRSFSPFQISVTNYRMQNRNRGRVLDFWGRRIISAHLDKEQRR